MPGCIERAAAIGLLIALAGCKTAEPDNAPRFYPAAVAVGCVKDRPSRPQSLAERISDAEWEQMPPGSQARAVQAQAGYWMNYRDRLEGATSGCKAVN